jgi:hypothetical protein
LIGRVAMSVNDPKRTCAPFKQEVGGVSHSEPALSASGACKKDLWTLATSRACG